MSYTPPTESVQAGINDYLASQSKQNTIDNSMGKDAFLKILVAQMKYQDPSQPMDSSQYIAQMAQFTSVEQLTNMANAVSSLTQMLTVSADANMIGKQIDWVQTDDSGNAQSYSGVVDSVTFDGSGNPYLDVNGQQVSLDQVTKIQAPSSATS